MTFSQARRTFHLGFTVLIGVVLAAGVITYILTGSSGPIGLYAIAAVALWFAIGTLLMAHTARREGSTRPWRDAIDKKRS
ncbi:MAG: hypothetical protein JWP75_132 [Frondihabitans sp.]|nr:hypothetical protein [Frondihabitans sp.]